MQFIDNAVKQSLAGRLPFFIFVTALLLGVFSLQQTPREEEPQISVPVLDVYVSTPNLEAPETVRLVTTPLEKVLSQLTGVKHIYSTTHTGQVVVTLRFVVGYDLQQAIVNTTNKLQAYQHKQPSVVTNWQIRPLDVNDVPMMMLGLFSTQPQLYGEFELTRFADEISSHLQQVKQVSVVEVIGGEQQSIQVLVSPQALAENKVSLLEVYHALEAANQLKQVGTLHNGQQAISIQSGDVIRSQKELAQLVVKQQDGGAVYLSDVATIYQGESEPQSYQWLANSAKQSQLPMVTLGVAKKQHTNAVTVAAEIQQVMAEIKTTILPPEVDYIILRDYGQTADEKVNNLTSSLVFAVFTVVVFIGVFLGWRPAIVVGLAVPICYGLTLALDFAFGYTINRVTLFALILSLGLLVDDPITGVDNISRFLQRKGNKKEQITRAMAEIRSALLMSTLTIMVAFIPLAFISGMMGPYMAPMAFNVPVSVAVSTLVAFFVTPWLAMKLLGSGSPTAPFKPDNPRADSSLYGKILTPLLANKRRTKWVLWITLLLFIASALLPVFRAVPLKLLPFDNKNELQILIDMPEGTSLEQTAAFTAQVQSLSWQLNEVTHIGAYVGQPSSMDFNAMVRGYYRRHAPHLAELRLLLLDKTQREQQSHAVVLRLREKLAPLAKNGIEIKVVEVPPGPPVLSTLVAEVYAAPFVDPTTHEQAVNLVAQRLRQEAHVVEVDTSLATDSPLWRYVSNKQKAAHLSISTAAINQTLEIALQGKQAGIYHLANEAHPVPIWLRLNYSSRNQESALLNLAMRAQITDKNAPYSPLVPLEQLGEFVPATVSKPIQRKNLRNVWYVTAELNGRTPAAVIADISADESISSFNKPSTTQTPWQNRSFINNGAGLKWQLPQGTSVTFSGEGEWRITLDVFRDMGIAFAFALTAIFIILRLQTKSVSLALIIMSAIPLTIIGIMPGFWLLNQFGERVVAGAPEPILFTATAMIGMIALAGIVVRNFLILVEFINQAQAQGTPLKTALINAGTVRMRPVLLTAGTTLLGNLIITLDPVFSGLAIAIIFGIVASTLFSLFIVPLVYFLVFDKPSAASEY